MRPLKLHCKPGNEPAIPTREHSAHKETPFLSGSAFSAATPRYPRNPRSEKLVRNPPPFAMKQVKAVRVNKPETGGKRRRH
jgi:hypothetical protein